MSEEKDWMDDIENLELDESKIMSQFHPTTSHPKETLQKIKEEGLTDYVDGILDAPVFVINKNTGELINFSDDKKIQSFEKTACAVKSTRYVNKKELIEEIEKIKPDKCYVLDILYDKSDSKIIRWCLWKKE